MTLIGRVDIITFPEVVVVIGGQTKPQFWTTADISRLWLAGWLNPKVDAK